MQAKAAYTQWAPQYDSQINRTRDLEAVCLRQMLAGYRFEHCLEMGCGTGKNTSFLAEISQTILAVDLTEAMLAKAKSKINAPNVTFMQADMLEDWDFGSTCFDLITFSLVLEHILELPPIFKKAANVLTKGGLLYLGELHPFKQYLGTKARFETASGLTEVSCFTHHLSDFITSATDAGFELSTIREFFDEGEDQKPPRILGLLFKKI